MKRRERLVKLPELPGRLTMRARVQYEMEVSGACPVGFEDAIRDAIKEALEPRFDRVLEEAVAGAVKRGVPEKQAHDAIWLLFRAGSVPRERVRVTRTREIGILVPPSERSRLVVGIDPFGFVIALHEEPCAEMGAFNLAKTWGDFRRTAPPRFRDEREAEWLERQESMVEEGETVELPSDEAPFDQLEFHGVADGDYPFPAQYMMDHLPLEVLLRHGYPVTTTLNGDYVAIEPAAMDDLIRDLELCGYSCRRDDAAIQAATQQ